MKRPLVYLLRDRTEADAYERVLRASGFDVAFHPVLNFEPLHANQLRERLAHPRQYAGLILTSVRAVNALSEAMAWLPTENVLWHSRPTFAVGPRTGAALREIGFEAEEDDSGSASELAERIGRRVFERPLLFLCGDRRLEDLPRRLTQAGIPFEELVVYRTVVEPSDELLQAAPPHWLVFFSPSGVEAAGSAGIFHWTETRLAAIGPTTAEAIRRIGHEVAAVAAQPTPEALARALGSVPEDKGP